MHTHEFRWSQQEGFRYASGAPQTVPAFVLVFGDTASIGSPECFPALRTEFPGSVIAGCSTAGHFDRHQVDEDGCFGVAVCLQHSCVALAVHELGAPTDGHNDGERLGRKLPRAGLKAVLVLSEGIHVNGTKLVAGLQAALGDDVLVSGGLAGDGERFGATLVIADAPARANIVVALGFYGDALDARTGSGGGWEVFGPRRRITRSVDNVLYDLDEGPALDLYERYLGEEAENLPASALHFPLRIENPRDPGVHVVRTVLGIDRETRAMIFAGDMPQNWSAQLMRGSFERIVEGSADAGSRVVGHGDDMKGFVLLVSCIGRRLLMGQRSIYEVTAVADQVPAGDAVIGFYSYGEIGPQAGSSCLQLHNQTMTVFSLRERTSP